MKIALNGLSSWWSQIRTKKVPLVLQYEMVECGAASLSMILRFYGCYLPLHILRDACGVSRDGSNMLDIKNAGAYFGLDGQALRLTAEQLMTTQGCFPCIAWMDHNHFVVLQGHQGNRLIVVDPALGRYSLQLKEVQKHFSGLVLYFEPGDGFLVQGKPENYVVDLLPIVLRYSRQLLLIAPISVALIVPALLQPGLSGAFISEVLSNSRFQYAFPILWLSCLALILFAGLTFARLRILRTIYLQMSRILFTQLANKLLSVNYLFYSSRYLGDITSRLDIADHISDVLALQLAPFLFGLVTAVFLIPAVWLISPFLAAASLLYVLINIVLAFLSIGFVLDQTKLIKLVEGKLSGLTLRIFSDVKTIKSSALEYQFLAQWQRLYQPLFDQNQNIQFTLNTFGSLESLSGSVYQYGTIALSGYLVMIGELNLAGFMAFQVIRDQVTQPLIAVSTMSHAIQDLNAELGRLNDLLTVADDPNVHSLQVTEPSQQRHAEFAGASIAVEANNVAVQLSVMKPPLIWKISASFNAGTMNTIVGPSGSGKSVFLKTLTGFYQPSEGTINYDGFPWSDYSDPVIRSAVGYVAQDVTALRGSVIDNITLHDPDITVDQVINACETAVLMDVIDQLPLGLHTQLGHSGAGLSGGQLQRLQIARALVREPKVLFLDEATSTLDIPTETQLLTNLKAMQITLVCVAHRLISAQMSDHLVVLQDGQLRESGSPSVLSASPDSFYAQLLKADSAQEEDRHEP